MLKPNSLFRFAVLALLPGAAALSPAQLKNVPPQKRVLSKAPVRESTFSVSPQIQPVYSYRRMEHEQGLKKTKLAARNNLPFGRQQSYSRVNPRSRYPGIAYTGYFPPDPDIAVGPDHIVEVVNVSIAIFEKSTGKKIFEQGLGLVNGASQGFFESLGVGSFVFDPKCYFDPISERYFVVALELDEASNPPVSKVLIGVSDDDDPRGTWSKYRLESLQVVTAGGNKNYWLDYPGFGFNKDTVVVTGNMFEVNGTTGNGVQYLVMPKQPMLNGDPVTVSYFGNNLAFTAQPARTHNTTVDKIYMVSEDTNSQFTMHALTGLPGTPVLTTATVAIPTYNYPVVYAESENNVFLDTLAFRMMNAWYRKGKMVTAHTVAGTDGETNAVRWYEFNMNNWPSGSEFPTVNQAGQVEAAPGTHYFMPAVAVNGYGSIATVFTGSSSSRAADFLAAARKVDDAPGTMSFSKLLESSRGLYGVSGGVNRWGDYFGLQVDPSDGRSFWGVGMIGVPGGVWETVFHKFQVDDAIASFRQPPYDVQKREGGTTSGTIANAQFSDNQYYTVPSVAVARTGQCSSAEFTFTVAIPAASLRNFQLTVESNGPQGATGLVYVYDWATLTYKHFASYPLNGTEFTKVISIPQPYTQFINSQRKIKVLVRALSPNTFNRSALPFNYKIDRVDVGSSAEPEF